MAKYVVRIKDYSENEFSLLITVPVFGAPTWQSIEKGWLRYNSGQAVLVDKTPLPMQGSGLEGFRRHQHLYICTYKWGVRGAAFCGMSGPCLRTRGRWGGPSLDEGPRVSGGAEAPRRLIVDPSRIGGL